MYYSLHFPPILLSDLLLHSTLRMILTQSRTLGTLLRRIANRIARSYTNFRQPFILTSNLFTLSS